MAVAFSAWGCIILVCLFDHTAVWISLIRTHVMTFRVYLLLWFNYGLFKPKLMLRPGALVWQYWEMLGSLMGITGFLTGVESCSLEPDWLLQEWIIVKWSLSLTQAFPNMCTCMLAFHLSPWVEKAWVSQLVPSSWASRTASYKNPFTLQTSQFCYRNITLSETPRIIPHNHSHQVHFLHR